MRQFITIAFGLYLLATDALLLVLAFVASYNLRLEQEPRARLTMLPLSAYQDLQGLIVLGVLASLFGCHLYLIRRGASRIDMFYSVFLAVTTGNLLALGASTFIFKGLDYPRWVLLYSWALSIALIWLSRVLADSIIGALRSLGINPQRLLIVGATESGRLIYERVSRWPGLGYVVVGFLEDDPALIPPADMPILGPIDAFPRVVREYNIDDVVFASHELSHRQILQLVNRCGKQRINVRVFPDVFQIMSSEVGVTELGGLPLVRVRDVALRGWNVAIKRAMDLVITGVGLVFLSPIMMLIALLIKATSGDGPVFFTQTRVGLDGKAFELVKFRSMVPDAESASGPVWAKEDDPRTTSFGRIIRRYSLDELPQLINVLVGEMSLVGPRPERPHFVEQFSQIIPRYEERHREKAGVTGWAQCNGLRGNTSIEERTKYDIFYVENWSPLFDIKILLRTVFAVFKGDNAY